jgi:DNA repair protein RecN (Recombination protein N)
MLLELNVRNFAIIREASVRFARGLNILTGETGAGKSLVIDAIQTLTGSRAKQIKIRQGADSARVEGLFGLAKSYPELDRLLGEAGIPAGDGEIVLARELYREGPSKCLVNGSLVTASLMGKIGGCLVDFHGQQEGARLKDPAMQLALLDAFGGTSEMAGHVFSLYERRRKLREEARAVQAEYADASARMGGLEEDLREIESLALEEGEEETLLEEKSRLENFEKISSMSGIIFDTLSNDETGITARLSRIEGSFEELARLAGELEESRKLFDGALFALDEVARRIGSFVQDAENNPGRLEEVRARLGEIARVKRKFGSTIAEVMGYRDRALGALERKRQLESRKEEIRKAIDEVSEILLAEAKGLSRERTEAARRLERETVKGMAALGLEKGKFRVELAERAAEGEGEGDRDAVGRTGLDRVHYLVGINPGEALLPLSQVASGGELSRIMLAIKTAIADKDRTPTLVFDEVDAGIGGEVGIKVGEKLAEVARSHQVLVVTHLPQIAVRAGEHFLVKKSKRGGRVDIDLQRLDREERTEEIARMLGGDPLSGISRQHAREMLDAVADNDRHSCESGNPESCGCRITSGMTDKAHQRN